MSIPLLNVILVTASLHPGIGVAGQVAGQLWLRPSISNHRPVISQIVPEDPQVVPEDPCGGFTLNNDQLRAISNNGRIRQMRGKTVAQISAIVDEMQQEGESVIDLTAAQKQTLRGGCNAAFFKSSTDYQGPDQGRYYQGPDQGRYYQGPDQGRYYQGPDQGRYTRTDQGRSPRQANTRVCEPVASNGAITVVTTKRGNVYQINFPGLGWNQLFFDEKCQSPTPRGDCNDLTCRETERTCTVFGCPLFSLFGNNGNKCKTWEVKIRCCTAVFT